MLPQELAGSPSHGQKSLTGPRLTNCPPSRPCTLTLPFNLLTQAQIRRHTGYSDSVLECRCAELRSTDRRTE